MEFGSPVLSFSKYISLFNNAFMLGFHAIVGNNWHIHSDRGRFFSLNKLLSEERQLENSKKKFEMWSKDELTTLWKNVNNRKYKNTTILALYNFCNQAKASFWFILFNLFGSSSLLLIRIHQKDTRLYSYIEPIYGYLPSELLYSNACLSVCILVTCILLYIASKINAYFSLFGPYMPNLDKYFDNHKLVKFAFHLGALIGFLFVLTGCLLVSGTVFLLIESFLNEPYSEGTPDKKHQDIEDKGNKFLNYGKLLEKGLNIVYKLASILDRFL